MIKPKALRRGDTIGIVAPAGPANLEELEKGVRRLERIGFRVILGKSVKKRARYMAGTDEERAADLMRMFQNPDVRAVLCARGGFGTSRVLPRLDEKAIRRHPKILVGSSDVTVMLNHFRQRFGWITFHGPMVASNFGQRTSALTETWFRRILMKDAASVGRRPIAVGGVVCLRGGRAQGRLAGGCLTMLCSSLGTPYEVGTEGTILLLEDVGEAPYRIDRMLTQLKAASKFKGVRGVVFGKMPGCRPPASSRYRLEEVILDVLEDVRVPILFGFPAGHGGEQVTLPLGVRAELDGDRASLTLLEGAVR